MNAIQVSICLERCIVLEDLGQMMNFGAQRKNSDNVQDFVSSKFVDYPKFFISTILYVYSLDTDISWI